MHLAVPLHACATDGSAEVKPTLGNKPTDRCEGNEDAMLDAGGDGDHYTNADVQIAALPLIPFRSTS